MNKVLHLKGTFDESSRPQMGGSANIPQNKSVNVSKIRQLIEDLTRLHVYWKERQDIIQGALVSVYYIKLAAKTNRIKQLLSFSKDPNSSIVGVRFDNDTPQKKHIITHLVSLETILTTIDHLTKTVNVLKSAPFHGSISHEQIKKIIEKELILDFTVHNISKTTFIDVIKDSYYVEKFDILTDNSDLQNNAIITLYDTQTDTKNLLDKLGIKILEDRILNNTTILLNPEEINLLRQKAPFLISMAVSDLNEITTEDLIPQTIASLSIPNPANEPTIGVIDTLFDNRVYFSRWVEYIDMVNPNIPREAKDYEHGTAISSIIVDGPSFNPSLQDNCGRFKVRHFGVATGKQFSSFTILKNIQEIISRNRDIKVWNLCLGSKMETSPNFISPEAAILDKIQRDNNVIFVIAGTNKTTNDKNDMRLGAPADSINAVVVNSVRNNNQPASYSRKGPVLAFFRKPDISYYGGDINERIHVCTPMGDAIVCGTSYAAPWISRKLCYLIDILGMSRELAKALLIHSATNWKTQDEESFNFMGNGIVPIDINQITHSANDEIRFMLSGKSKQYNTYSYNIPIPAYNGRHPFITKATLCYFPRCSRNQGVDYTNTELDIQFGRLTPKKVKTTKNKSKDINGIKPIDNNYQSIPGHYTLESTAREYFRKWDNVKHIREIFTGKNQPKKAYQTTLWGLSLKRNERLYPSYEEDINFGIIISIKHLRGENKIEDFIQNCQLRGWLVNAIDVDNRIEIYNQSEEEIIFEE